MPRRQDDNASWRPHDTDRSIDPFDDGGRSTRPPSSRPAVPPPSRPGGQRPSASRPTAARGAAPARRPSPDGRRVELRTVLLVGGGLLAVVATVLVFLTDDPDLLRVAVVAAAWAFVLATFVAGRGRSERVEAAGREAALRRTYEHELEREVAARREYELELENDLRREAEETMRAELDALRGELSGLTELRGEVARVAELREDVARVAELRADVADLSTLRDEVARLAALREDVLSLTALRAELGQIGELRADLGRLRAEIVEQLSSEMLVERIVMRTQAARLPAGEATRIEAGAPWREEPPRELTGGWPAVRLDEQPGTQQYERVRVERTAPQRPREPATGGLATPAPPPPYVAPSTPAPQPQAAPEPAWQDSEPPAWTASAPVTEAYSLLLPPRRSQHADEAAGIGPEPVAPPPSPMEWLAARSLVEEDPAAPPRPLPRRRRTDDDIPNRTVDEILTTERPAAPTGYPFGTSTAAAEPAAPGHSRLEEILAESGVQPATGSRRRRRYRDEDDSEDDVLSRVLRGG